MQSSLSDVIYEQFRELFYYYIYSPQIRIPSILATGSLLICFYCTKLFLYLKQIKEYFQLPPLTYIHQLDIKSFRQIDNNLYESQQMLLQGWLHSLFDQSMFILTPKKFYNNSTTKLDLDLSKNENLLNSVRNKQRSIQLPQIGSYILSCVLCQLEYNSITQRISAKNIKYLLPSSSLWSCLYQKIRMSTILMLVYTVLSATSIYSLYQKYKEILEHQNDRQQLIYEDDEQLYQNTQLEMDIEKGLYCLQCSTKGRRVVVMPCSHLVYCKNCWDQQTHCPTCNQPIKTYSILYLND